MRTTVILVCLMLAVSYLPNASADNSERQNGLDERIVMQTPTSGFIDMLETGDTNEQWVCGWSVDRLTRGDDCSSKNDLEAPKERWFRYVIPANSMGDKFEIEVRNLDTPHYVDLNVTFCETNPFEPTEMLCDKEPTGMYSNTVEIFKFNPIVTEIVWILVEAYDEELYDRDAGGDATKVRVHVYDQILSNEDGIEPTVITSEATFDRRVCAEGCDSNDEDPLDVFAYDGIEGDKIEFQFGSRENDFSCDIDLLVEVNFETDFFDTSISNKYWWLDDCFHYHNYPGPGNEGISNWEYTFHTSGTVYIWFEAEKGGESSEDAESFTLEVKNLDISNRIVTADRDMDGLPDLEEMDCGSDFRDAASTADNFDGDLECDANDLDDDNDGVLDTEDPCPKSPSTIDYDGDGCDDNNDIDDDGDGKEDINDECPNSILPLTADFDSDGCHDSEDLDDDDDTWSDTKEAACNTNPKDATDVPSNFDNDYETYWYLTNDEDILECDALDDDDDSDGVKDVQDACPMSQWYEYDAQNNALNILDTDTDGDGCFNSEDDDDDNDQILDINDNCPRGLAIGGDMDGDGCKDSEDIDIDGDTYSNAYESDCGTSATDGNDIPFGPSWDLDGDLICDKVDEDDDGDGYVDGLDAFPRDANEYRDTDGDGEGDNFDLDDDGDGIIDDVDDFPLNKDESKDTDGDGIGNNEDTDDDDDGWLDRVEVECQKDPLDRFSIPVDTDDDDECNVVDDDDDGDGSADALEIKCGSDPLADFETHLKFDMDGDSLCDNEDPDIDGDGVNNNYDECTNVPKSAQEKSAVDSEGCLDSDGDGFMNFEDKCSNTNSDTNDGCPVSEESFFSENMTLIIVLTSLIAAIVLGLAYFKRNSLSEMLHIGKDTSTELAKLGVNQTTTITNTNIDNSKKETLSILNQQSVTNKKSFSNVLNASKGSNINTNDTYTVEDQTGLESDKNE